MAKTFEQSLLLQPDPGLPGTFTNVHPPWTWPSSTVVPGGTLMALSAAAARTTLLSSLISSPPTASASGSSNVNSVVGVALNNLQIHFLAGPNAAKPISLTVNRVSSSRRFHVLTVDVRQHGRPMCLVTCTFMTAAAGPWKGRAMKHAAPRAVGSPQVSRIAVEHDDLSLGRSSGGQHSGPFMAFQRLPLMVDGDDKPSPEHTIAPIACHITPAITSDDPFIHVLGVLSLSDYHVLDFPPAAHGIPFGLAPIGQPVSNTTLSQVKFFTSLNHTIHFERNDGFRADEIMYVQVTSPWASNGRAVMNTKIFTGQENLVATCVQEAYYILQDDAQSGAGSKL
ncbi:hypothetical protein DV735_g4387, partial [Chaetothyriales sp. CBS 134920]